MVSAGMKENRLILRGLNGSLDFPLKEKERANKTTKLMGHCHFSTSVGTLRRNNYKGKIPIIFQENQISPKLIRERGNKFCSLGFSKDSQTGGEGRRNGIEEKTFELHCVFHVFELGFVWLGGEFYDCC